MAALPRIMSSIGVFDRFEVPVRGNSNFARVMERWLPHETGSGYHWIASRGNSRRSQLDSAAHAIARSAPHIVEVLPGVLLPAIVDRMPPFTVPVLAGGFIRTEADVRAVLNAGALGVTTSTTALWGDDAG